MLLNEFLKAGRQIDLQQKQIDALTAGLPKVSAQLELNKLAPQTVKERRLRFGFVKYWEIIADNLSKAGWSLGWVSAVILRGERCGLLMHTAATEGASLYAQMKAQRVR